MKLKKVKFENIYLLMVIIQLIGWALKGALSCDCIVYYICIMITYYTIKFLRRYKED